MLDIDQQVLRTGLRPVVDLVDGPHLAGRDAGCRQALQQRLTVCCRECAALR